MGRIKSIEIKKISKRLVSQQPGALSKEFNKNKKALRGMVANKRMRNSVAGYIARLMKRI